MTTKNRRKPMTAEDRAFHQGAAIALGILAREHGEPGTAADITRLMGLTLADFRQARCQPYDLRTFSKQLLHLERLERDKKSRG